MKHVMVDIESLGTRPGSVVLSIGACRFDEDGASATGRAHWTIDVFDSLMHGLTIDEETVVWWRGLGFEAQLLANDEHQRLPTVLDEFSEYLYVERVSGAGPCVWAKGPDFDLVLLDAAYRAASRKRPWHYRDARDVRTILALAPDVAMGVKRQGPKHFALADAIYQAEQVAAVYRALGRRLE